MEDRDAVAKMMRMELSAFLFLVSEYNQEKGDVGWKDRFNWFLERRKFLRGWLDKPIKRRARRRKAPRFMFNVTESDEGTERPTGSLKDLLNETTFVIKGQEGEEDGRNGGECGEVEVVCNGSTTHVSETTEDEDCVIHTSTPLSDMQGVIRCSLSPIGK